MIRESGLAEARGQKLGDLLAGPAGSGVDDCRQRVGRGQGGGQPALLLGRAAAGDDDEAQVGAVKAGRDLSRVAQAQAVDDVGGHRGGGGRGESERGPGADRRGGIGEGEVVGAKVVAPLRDAVGLVDHEQPDPGAGDGGREGWRAKPLGRHVEQP